MIPERGVSYTGVTYTDRAELDLEEMRVHGCNAVLLAVSEFDWWFWRPATVKLIDAARSHGLKPYVDLWGWGKTLAGEPPSIYLMEHVEGRQRAASGKAYNAMCLNYSPFRDHLKQAVTELITLTGVEGVFLDEPHYANWYSPDWACTCPICRGLYREATGEEMPPALTGEVAEFRASRAVGFLEDVASHVKQVDPMVETVCCLLPTESPLIGLTDWTRVAELGCLDVLGTDPYYYQTGMTREQGLRFFRETSSRLISLAEAHGKRSQLWLMGYNVPDGRESELLEAADIAADLGADSLFTWTYRGGEGAYYRSSNPGKVWDTVGEAYRRHRA